MDGVLFLAFAFFNVFMPLLRPTKQFVRIIFF